ncbi:hypothetical protein MKX01_015671 [Papaver californicum]|nr:hypothetical protein MKX01_015671 [Papaver californicum]
MGFTNEKEQKSTEMDKGNPPNVYKVGVPRQPDLMKEFTGGMKETFFSDDPLRQFKGQSSSRKFVLAIQDYNFTKFKGDIISGLTIASICIPQDIGYTRLANLDPQYGLFNFVPPLIYAFMGSSRDIAIGPVAVVSLLLGSLLQNEIDPIANATEYCRLAFTATFFAGATQATLGVLRLGFLIDFLSHAAIVGFMGGAAITIALQQLRGFLGIKKFTKKTNIISVMLSAWGNVHHGWNWQTILIAAVFLSYLLFAKYLGKKNKRLFWVSAIAHLISVVLSTSFVYITRADKVGVQTVKYIQSGINPSSADEIYFRGNYVLKGFKIGVVAGIIGLTEAVDIGRTFASMKDYQLDGNNEMVALDAMNIVGSVSSCYVATGSFSRSAVNYMYTPNAILSSIIISAVIGLIDYEAALLIWKIDKFDFVACLGAFLDASKIPGVLIVRVDSAIYFSNSNYVKERILRWLADEEDYLNANGLPRIDFLIVEMSHVIDIDTSGIHALGELYRALQKKDVKLGIANPGHLVIDKLHASTFAELIGEGNICLSVWDAVLTQAPKVVDEA